MLNNSFKSVTNIIYFPRFTCSYCAVTNAEQILNKHRFAYTVCDEKKSFQCLQQPPHANFILVSPPPRLRVPTTSWDARLFRSPQPAEYGRMHKKFNRVDLMRTQGRREEAAHAVDLLLPSSEPIGQSRCIDRGQWGVVLAPWSLSWELRMGQAKAKLQLCVNNASIYNTICLIFLIKPFFLRDYRLQQWKVTLLAYLTCFKSNFKQV